jgi:proteasome lid subunit RPN8/RPN11
MVKLDITIKSELLSAMVGHALTELPNECCGVLVGRDGIIERMIPMASTHPSPNAYFMDPEQQINAYTEMEQRGEQLIGIYHSHPVGPPYPSHTDIKLAFHPEALYFIVDLKDKEKPGLRAFSINREHVMEVAIHAISGQK